MAATSQDSAFSHLAEQLSDERWKGLRTKPYTDASGDSIIINVGKRSGVNVGDRLEVRRKIREIKDPSSGKVIKRVEDKIGEMV